MLGKVSVDPLVLVFQGYGAVVLNYEDPNLVTKRVRLLLKVSDHSQPPSVPYKEVLQHQSPRGPILQRSSQ